MTKQEIAKIDWAYKAIMPFIENIGDIHSKEILVYNLVKNVLFDKSKILANPDDEDFGDALKLVCEAFALRVAQMPEAMERFVNAGTTNVCTCLSCTLLEALRQATAKAEVANAKAEAAKSAGKTTTETKQGEN